MLDYYAHMASLKTLQAELETLLGPSDPSLQALVGNPSFAALGAIIDHLFEHAGSSTLELDLLGSASQLWGMFRKYLIDVADVRNVFESLVLNPQQPDAFATFNALSDKLESDLRPTYNILLAQLQAFYAKVRNLKYIPQHGQALDQPVQQWSWRDIILSRRTGAFMVNLVAAAKAEGSPQSLAFAFGALANYASNAIGSTYLDHTVGGPRRSHLHRNRLASYSVGVWLHKNTSLTMPLQQLRSLLSYGPPNAPSLPQTINQIMMKALDTTYGQHQLGPYPDLGQAYKNLMQHLELLTSFSPLPLPQPINSTLLTSILTLHITGGPSGSPPPPAGPAPQPQPSGSSSNKKPWYYYVAVVACFIATAVCYLMGLCGGSPGKPPKDPYPDPTTKPADPQALTQYLTSNDALASVNVMFDLHCQLYQLALDCLKVLKILGMVYPEDMDLGGTLFSQFTTIPSIAFPLPKRPIANRDYFLAFPDSLTEDPSVAPSPFAVGSSPTVFLSGAQQTVGTYGIELWTQEILGQGSFDELHKVNRNLDGDRGFLYQCWEVTPGGSIFDNPVPVSILTYSAI